MSINQNLIAQLETLKHRAVQDYLNAKDYAGRIHARKLKAIIEMAIEAHQAAEPKGVNVAFRGALLSY